MERKYSFAPEPMSKTDQYILGHLAPVEYGLYHDTYLCGVTIENKNWYTYTLLEKVQKWVQRNGGKCVVLDKEKYICRSLGKKGFVVQIVFPSFTRRDMKNIMATLHTKNVKRIKIA